MTIGWAYAYFYLLVATKGTRVVVKFTVFFTLMVNYVNNNYNLSIQVEVVIGNEEPISETFKWIAHGPSHYVFKYHGYVINGYHYHTKECDDLQAT